jgi:gliding motility-associated-like protein
MDVQLIANDPNPATGTWSLVSGTGVPTPANTFVTTAAGVDTGTSVFQWLVVNNTCRDSAQLTVIHDGVDDCGDLEANELITPNQDALNERLQFAGLNKFPNSKLIIFNRWGSEVFSQNNYQNDWRGRTEVGYTGDELPDGNLLLCAYRSGKGIHCGIC